MNIFWGIAWLFLLGYLLMNGIFIFTWLLISDSTKRKDAPFLSILIPVRNEEKTILALLEDLEAQSYDKARFEVLVIDDSSTDETSTIVSRFLERSSLPLRLLSLTPIPNNNSPKKRAITEAIRHAEGELIITTDGDCRVKKDWLSSLSGFYVTTDATLISAPVSFLSPTRKDSFWMYLFTQLQIVEFSSLLGAAACSMRLKMPNMCSGANLAYKRHVFWEVNGYEGNEAVASGDDEFLMHKIACRYPKGVHFLKDKRSIVSTLACPDFRSFYEQRNRWASKWRFYTGWQPKFLAIFIFIIQFFTIVSLLSANWLFVGLKFFVEFAFLTQVLLFLNKKSSLFFLPLTQILYPFYVVWFGLLAQRKRAYEWKGRSLS